MFQDDIVSHVMEGTLDSVFGCVYRVPEHGSEFHGNTFSQQIKDAGEILHSQKPGIER